MMMDMTPSMVIYACFLGPFMEELLFRGMILKRARRFGDRTAVAFTAVLFGLIYLVWTVSDAVTGRLEHRTDYL